MLAVPVTAPLPEALRCSKRGLRSFFTPIITYESRYVVAVPKLAKAEVPKSFAITCGPKVCTQKKQIAQKAACAPKRVS